jgi:glycine betaine/proline transport system substrate-binding protein
MFRKILLTAATAVAAIGLAFGSAEAQNKKVKIAYVEWSDAIVATNILKEALASKGYDVTITPLAAAAMWQAVATGEADAMVAAWLPATHASYYGQLKDKVDLIGPNVTGAKIGWAVPKYTELSTIEDLKTKGSLVENKVIGIDPGAGLMKASDKAIKEYALPVKLVDGSDATMAAALKDAYDRKQNIVVTAWTPHWMFARWDMKYLDDPKNVFGGEETVNTVARKDLKKDNPELYSILSKFKLSLDDEQKVMVWNEEKGAKPAETAQRWIKENPDKVKAWLQ